MRAAILFGAVTVVGCGGSGEPRITTTRPTTVGVAQAGSGVVSGVVVGNQDRVPVAGAQIKANGATVIADAQGRFQLTGLPAGPVQYEVSAPAHLPHVSQVMVSGTRDGLTFDLIADADPFVLGFYRQFARNGLENAAALQSTHSWSTAPRFYMRTVTDDTGTAVSPDILAAVRRVIMNSVPELSGGRFVVDTFETGSAARALQQGWVIVTFFAAFPGNVPGDPNQTLGDSSIGGDTGRLRLLYDAPRLEPRIDCSAWIVAVADHEIVHTMGFYHTGAPWGGGSDYDFQSVGCSGLGHKDRTRYHAAVMYSRPAGNNDLDYDPLTFWTEVPTAIAPPVVRCTAADVRR